MQQFREERTSFIAVKLSRPEHFVCHKRPLKVYMILQKDLVDIAEALPCQEVRGLVDKDSVADVCCCHISG